MRGSFMFQLSPHDLAIYALGFFAQSLFGTRILIQWIKSEREGRVVSPTVFWILSLTASFLFLIYGVLRHDAVILFGQTISFYIYIRNLQLKGFWVRIPRLIRIVISPLPFALLGWMAVMHPQSFHTIVGKTNFADAIIVIGTIGQLLLNFRYFYQWYFSERANESLLPLGFWLISAFASVLVVYYAINRHDPVLLVSQSMGFVAYARNSYLAWRSREVSSQ
ncbi:MAG: lipid-A-disaccharide synthase N-terminal domain-containing protein [Cyclobacteriaceae bacterium]|nr:lipid-A-disaccharide synthase N-terminal domain-containing protein [Cyclobacteriaceae bacterium]